MPLQAATFDGDRFADADDHVVWDLEESGGRGEVEGMHSGLSYQAVVADRGGLLLTKSLPLDDLAAAEALAPLLAFIELLEDKPKPSRLLHRGGTNVLCFSCSADALSLLFNHPKLAAGVETALQAELPGAIQLHSYTQTIQLLAVEEAVLAKALEERVRMILFKESRDLRFMLRSSPYREPGLVLRDWNLDVADGCMCMRLKCGSCRITRWEKTSVCKKASIAVPPLCAVQQVPYCSPPSEARFDAKSNPFCWYFRGVHTNASIW